MTQASWDWHRPLATYFTLVHQNKMPSSSSFFFLLEKTHKQNPSHFLKTQGHGYGHGHSSRSVLSVAAAWGWSAKHHCSVAHCPSFTGLLLLSPCPPVPPVPLSLVRPHCSDCVCGFNLVTCTRALGLRFCSGTLTARRLLH